MTRTWMRALWVCVVGVAVLGGRQAYAQQQAPPAGAQAAMDEPDDDTRPDPAEPDFRLINLPTTLRLPSHTGNFSLSHRFNGDLRANSFGRNLETMFGIDEGAAIALEYRFAPVRRVQAVIARTNIERVISFGGRFDAIREGASPVSVTALVTVEGTNNFRDEYTPSVGAVISRKLFADHLAVYAVPMWLHNTSLGTGSDENTAMLGIGGRYRLHGRTYVVAEVTPRLSGFTPGDALYAFAIEKRVGGHVFQLNFANGQATSFGQIAQGGFPKSLHFGFNLSRKFF